MKNSFLVVLTFFACGGQTETGDAGDAGSDMITSDYFVKDVVVPDASYPDAPGEPPPEPDGGGATTNVYTFRS